MPRLSRAADRALKPAFGAIDGAAIVVACYTALRDDVPDRPFVLASAASLVVWQWLENGYQRRRFGAHRYPAYPDGLAWAAAAFAAVLVTSAVERLVDGGGTATPAALGFALCVAGVAVRVWAFGALGERFVRPAGAAFERSTEGPYRFMRHPAALGLLLAGAGTALAWNAVWGLAAAALFLLPSVIVVSAAETRANRAPRARRA